jgi:hypothetical protein
MTFPAESITGLVYFQIFFLCFCSAPWLGFALLLASFELPLALV